MSSRATIAERVRRQRGQALVLGLLLVLVVAAALVLTAQQQAVVSQAQQAEREQKALAAAREFLVAYALAFGANNHPGALPCPDVDGDGASNNTDCQGEDVYLGRVPVATVDADRSSLAGADAIWYAVGDAFVDFNPPGGSVNTGTPATLAIGGGADRYAAVLIAADDPVPGQEGARPDSDDPTDYLEGANVNDPPLQFASCDRSDCNDQVVGITKRDLLAPVRRRLRGELAATLEAFAQDDDTLPFAAPLGDADGDCDPGRARGTLAVEPGACGADAHLEQVDDGGTLPDWIEDNDWHRYVYYAAAAPCLPDAGGCTAGDSGLLQLADTAARASVFATVGQPIVSAAKASLQQRSGAPPRGVIGYLDSAENVNEDTIFDDPPNGDGENDGFGAIPAPSP